MTPPDPPGSALAPPPSASAEAPPTPAPSGEPAPAPRRMPLSAAKAAFTSLIASHAVIDMFPMYLTSLMLVWTRDLGLSNTQVAIIYAATPIFSGLCQPFFAWLGDKRDSRLAGPVGMTVGALSIGSIGFATTFEQFLALQIIGVIGTGVYHPVCTALAGQTGARALRPGRTGGRALAIGVFISAGMLGHTIGPIVATRLNNAFGTPVHIVFTIIPALLVALVLLLTTRRLPHRHDNHAELHAAISPAEARLRRGAVINLAAQNALRFIANTGMFVMFNVWAASKWRAVADGATRTADEIADLAASLSANLAAAMTIGMGISVIATGRLIAPGREHRPLFALSIVGAVFMALIGPVGDLIAPRGLGHLDLLPMYVCAALAPIGFFSTFPIATSLAQRLLPGHTGLVTSLMMGVGWAIASLHAPLAIAFFGFTGIKAAELLDPWRINMGFYGFASLLIIAGLLALALPKRMLADAAAHH